MQTGEACAAHVSEQPFEASFHPISPLLAACTIVGTLEVIFLLRSSKNEYDMAGLIMCLVSFQNL